MDVYVTGSAIHGDIIYFDATFTDPHIASDFINWTGNIVTAPNQGLITGFETGGGTTPAVPEPASLLLLGSGLTCLVVARRRLRK